MRKTGVHLTNTTRFDVLDRAFCHGDNDRNQQAQCATDPPLLPSTVLPKLMGTIRVDRDTRLEIRRGWIDSSEHVMLTQAIRSAGRYGDGITFPRFILDDVVALLGALSRTLSSDGRPGRGQGRLF